LLWPDAQINRLDTPTLHRPVRLQSKTSSTLAPTPRQPRWRHLPDCLSRP